MSKKKLILRLDSHMLSDFQRCKRLGKLAAVEGWRKPITPWGLIRGTRWHMLMEFRSLLKQGIIKSWPEVLSRATAYLVEDGVETDEIAFFIIKLNQYQAHWEGASEEGWKFLDNEVGFSKVLFENEEVQFIYEGKIDALIDVNGYLTVVDHKTQHPGFSSRKFDLFPHNNQFLGYCWAAKSEYVMIDYTVWSNVKSKISDRTFRRQPYPISRDLVKQWKKDTIASFWEILLAIRFGDYRRNRAACDGKYGICDFHGVCEHNSERSQLITLKTNFIKQERWEPWKVEDGGNKCLNVNTQNSLKK